MNEDELLARITTNPAIFGGKPLIRGMRIAVEHVLGMLAGGDTPERLLQEYPFLETADIQACLAYAHRSLTGEQVQDRITGAKASWKELLRYGQEKNDELPKGEVLVYQTENGRIKLDVRLEDETVWLTQPLMAELFQTTQQNISQHILNIYEEGELIEEATHKKILSVRQEGIRQVQRSLDFYNCL
jgi:uncharacterized protein (DUF433 family)